MEQSKRIAKNTGFLYARMFITVFVSLYVTRLVLDALGTEDFGTFNLIGGTIAMLTFLNIAMASASQRFMSFAQGEGDKEKQKNIFNVSVLIHFCIGIVLVLLLEIAGHILFNGVLVINPERIEVAKLIYQFVIVSTFMNMISVPYDAVINAHQNMLFVAVIAVIESFFKLGIAFYITYTNFDKLLSYGLLMASLTILLLITKRIYCQIKYEEVTINIRKYFNKTLFKEMTSFASWSFLGSFASITSNYGQGILLNKFFGTNVNAAQGVSNQISGQLQAFSAAMIQAINPAIVMNEGANEREKMLELSLTGSKISFFLLALFVVPFIIEIDYIFGIWLTVIPEFTKTFTILLLTRKLIAQLFVTLSTTIDAVGQIKGKQIGTAILELSILVITYVLFSNGYPPFTIYVVFIVIVFIRTFGVTLYFANKYARLNISFFIKKIVLGSLFSLLIPVVIVLLMKNFLEVGFFRLISVTIIFGICYAISSLLIVLNNKERMTIKMLLNNLINR